MASCRDDCQWQNRHASDESNQSHAFIPPSRLSPSPSGLYDLSSYKRTLIRRDSHRWRHMILPQCHKFGQFMTRTLADSEWQRKYFRANEGERLHMLKEIVPDNKTQAAPSYSAYSSSSYSSSSSSSSYSSSSLSPSTRLPSSPPSHRRR